MQTPRQHRRTTLTHEVDIMQGPLWFASITREGRTSHSIAFATVIDPLTRDRIPVGPQGALHAARAQHPSRSEPTR